MLIDCEAAVEFVELIWLDKSLIRCVILVMLASIREVDVTIVETEAANDTTELDADEVNVDCNDILAWACANCVLKSLFVDSTELNELVKELTVFWRTDTVVERLEFKEAIASNFSWVVED